MIVYTSKYTYLTFCIIYYCGIVKAKNWHYKASNVLIIVLKLQRNTLPGILAK